MVGFMHISEPYLAFTIVKVSQDCNNLILFYNPDWFLQIKFKIIQDSKICIYFTKSHF